MRPESYFGFGFLAGLLLSLFFLGSIYCAGGRDRGYCQATCDQNKQAWALDHQGKCVCGGHPY